MDNRVEYNEFLVDFYVMHTVHFLILNILKNKIQIIVSVFTYQLLQVSASEYHLQGVY